MDGFIVSVYMKKILFLICLVLVGKMATAQKDSLAFDDHGKYIYYKVVNAGANNANVLYTRAESFLKAAYDKTTLKLLSQDVNAKSLIGEGNVMVAKTGSLSKHNDGRITCKLNVEVKDMKYRYWFTDFVYTPYKLDRYNNYVPEIGLDVEMEKAAKRLSQKDTDHYLDECARFARQMGAKLQLYMAAAPVVKKDTVAKKVISINKW
jgi:hypothetical protein